MASRFVRAIRAPLAAAAIAACAAQPLAAQSGGGIEPLVQAVAGDSLLAAVEWLQSYLTRRADTPQAMQAAEWMAGRMAAWGADSVFSHRWSSAYAPNVVGIRRGTTRPRRVVLVGGHFDSIAPGIAAPGADDNGSGTACVLECARILSRERFECTLQFAAFSAEEIGLVGSNAYAAHLQARGDTVVAMLNVDMIGYLAPFDRRDLDIIANPASLWLRDAAVQALAQYVPGLPAVDGAYRTGRSDQESFWVRGMSAISFFEDSDAPSPFIHTGDDVLFTSFNDLPLATGATRAAVALLATLARPATTPVAVPHLVARSVAEGAALEWTLASAQHWAGIGVQRAAAAPGPWADATDSPLPPARRMTFVDRSATGDAPWYRLALHATGGETVFSTPILLDGAALAAVWLAPPLDRGDRGVDLRWSIPEAGPAALAVFDARGRRIRVLAAGTQPAGAHLSTWDRSDESGRVAARGVYFVHLRAPSGDASRKVVVAR